MLNRLMVLVCFWPWMLADAVNRNTPAAKDARSREARRVGLLKQYAELGDAIYAALERHDEAEYDRLYAKREVVKRDPDFGFVAVGGEG